MRWEKYRCFQLGRAKLLNMFAKCNEKFDVFDNLQFTNCRSKNRNVRHTHLSVCLKSCEPMGKGAGGGGDAIGHIEYAILPQSPDVLGQVWSAAVVRDICNRRAIAYNCMRPANVKTASRPSHYFSSHVYSNCIQDSSKYRVLLRHQRVEVTLAGFSTAAGRQQIYLSPTELHMLVNKQESKYNLCQSQTMDVDGYRNINLPDTLRSEAKSCIEWVASSDLYHVPHELYGLNYLPTMIQKQIRRFLGVLPPITRTLEKSKCG